MLSLWMAVSDGAAARAVLLNAKAMTVRTEKLPQDRMIRCLSGSSVENSEERKTSSRCTLNRTRPQYQADMDAPETCRVDLRVSAAYSRPARLIDSPPSRSSCEYELVVVTLTCIAGRSRQWWGANGGSVDDVTWMYIRWQHIYCSKPCGKPSTIRAWHQCWQSKTYHIDFIIRISHKGHFVHSLPQERGALSSSTISSPYTLFLRSISESISINDHCCCKQYG
jgi:hypothetical protein